MKIIKTAKYIKKTANQSYGNFEIEEFQLGDQKYYVEGYISDTYYQESEPEVGFRGGTEIEGIELTRLFNAEDENAEFPILPGTKEYEAVKKELLGDSVLYSYLQDPSDVDGDYKDFGDYGVYDEPGRESFN